MQYRSNVLRYLKTLTQWSAWKEIHLSSKTSELLIMQEIVFC